MFGVYYWWTDDGISWILFHDNVNSEVYRLTIGICWMTWFRVSELLPKSRCNKPHVRYFSGSPDQFLLWRTICFKIPATTYVTRPEFFRFLTVGQFDGVECTLQLPTMSVHLWDNVIQEINKLMSQSQNLKAWSVAYCCNLCEGRRHLQHLQQHLKIVMQY